MGVRISALPALSTLTSDDITVFVNDTGGANPVTSKVNFADLRTSVLAGTALDTISVTANGDTLITGGSSNTTLLQGEIIQNTANNNYISGNNLEIDAITTFTGNSFTMNTVLTNTGNTILGTPYQTQQLDENGAPVVDENGDAVLVEFVPITQIDGTLVINASANVVGLSLLDLDNANGDNIADGTADQTLTTDGSGNFKFTNSLPFGTVDPATTPDGSSLVYNDGVYGTATWNHANPFTVTLSEEHHFSNGDIATIDADDQTYDGQSYYVGVVNSTHIGFYSDPELTAPIDGSGFSATPNTDATVTQSDGAQFEPRSLNLNDLGNVNATPTNGQVLTWNGSSNLWYGADSTGGGGSEAGGGVDVDSTSLVDGDTIVWDDQKYTIVDLIDDPNDATKIIIDFGTQAHGQIGASAWGIFNGSGGSTELNLSEYHKIVQINSDASVNSYYTLSFGNATSDTVSDTDLASNTSAWTSGGYFQTVVTVDGATSNTDGKWIATAQSELTAPDLTSSSIGELTDVDTSSANHVPTDGQVLTWHSSHNHWMPMDVSIPGSSNTGGVPITNPEANLGAGDQLTWSDGIVGRGQIGGITNTGTQPAYVTSSELGHEVEFSRPGTPVIMPSPDPADYFTPGSTLAEIDAADYERVVGRFLDLHDTGGASSALNGVYLELTTATSSIANTNPEGTGKRRYHMIKLDQSTRARLTHANGEYQVYEAPSGSQDINGITLHDADARFERVDPATGTAKQGWVALPNPEADISDSPLGELKDVDVSGVADGNIIKYVAANTTYVAASLDDALESTGAPVMYGPGGEKANTALFNEGDILSWDNQQYSISAVSLADPAVVTLSGDHTLQDGAYIQITGVVGMTELNSNFYYVNAISNTEVELYTDAGLTTGVDSVGFTAYSSGGTLAGPGNWTVSTPFSNGSETANTGGVAITNPEGDLAEGQSLTWHTGTITGDFVGGGYDMMFTSWMTDTQAWKLTWANTYNSPGAYKANPDPTDFWGHVNAVSKSTIDASDYNRIVGRFTGTTDTTGNSNPLNGTIVELLYGGDSPYGWRRNYHVLKLDQTTRERLTHANGDYQFYTNSDTGTDIDLFEDPQPANVAFERLDPATGSAYPAGWVSFTYEPNIANSEIRELSDVDTDMSPTDGQILKYSTSPTEWRAGDLEINELTDVWTNEVSNRTNGQAIIWDTREWTITNVVKGANTALPVIITLAEDHNLVSTNSEIASSEAIISITGVTGFIDSSDGYNRTINGSFKARTEHANGTPLASNELALYSDSYTSWMPRSFDQATAWTGGGTVSMGGGKFVLANVQTTSSGGGGGASVSVSDTAPSSPSDGDLWWESDTGRLKIYYNDGTSSQWVDSFTAGSAADKNIFSGATKEEVNIVASAGSGAVDYDCSAHSIHHLSSLTGDIQANLTNLSLAEGHATTITFVVNQGATSRIVDALSIGGVSQTVQWVGGSVPFGTNNGTDVQSFSIIRTGASSYTVLAQLVPFS